MRRDELTVLFHRLWIKSNLGRYGVVTIFTCDCGFIDFTNLLSSIVSFEWEMKMFKLSRAGKNVVAEVQRWQYFLLSNGVEYRTYKRHIARIPHVLNFALLQNFGQFTAKRCAS